MSKAERRRVSSGILTDHPDLKAGEAAHYFHGEYFYQFTVNSPGEYHFTGRLPIVGNEKIISNIIGGVGGT